MRRDTSPWVWRCAVVTLAVVVAGCGPKTLDTSSVDKLEKALTALREPLELDERNRFDEALTYLVGGGALLNEEAQATHPGIVLALYRPLAGMTVEDVFAEALRRRLEEVQGAVTELEKDREGSDTNREILDAFDLRASRVYKKNRGFLEWPIVEFKVQNNTDQVIWLIHFRAALLRPGDEEPWLVEKFDQLVLDGLPPGEGDLWRIEPERQEWVTLVDPHPDLVYTLDVMSLEGLGGNVIAATTWGGIESARLALYQKTLDEIRTTGGLALDRPPRAAGQG